jgi:hypothetical protein
VWCSHFMESVPPLLRPWLLRHATLQRTNPQCQFELKLGADAPDVQPPYLQYYYDLREQDPAMTFQLLQIAKELDLYPLECLVFSVLALDSRLGWTPHWDQYFSTTYVTIPWHGRGRRNAPLWYNNKQVGRMEWMWKGHARLALRHPFTWMSYFTVAQVGRRFVVSDVTQVQKPPVRVLRPRTGAVRGVSCI